MEEKKIHQQNLSIQTVVGGPVDVNTYVIGLEGSDACVLIDPGAEVARVAKAVGSRRVEAVLLTHAHFDHMMYAEHWLKLGAKLYVQQLDAPALKETSLNLSGMILAELRLPDADIQVIEGDIVREAGIELTVLHTPGHTPGSVCYLYTGTLFSGDTLFYGSYGRVDFPGGSMRQMRDSLNRLYHLDDQVVAYPGHGAKTKIVWERGMSL